MTSDVASLMKRPALQQPARYDPAPPVKPRKAPTGMIECPPPGVYPNVPFEQYLTWDALNHSTLKKMGTTPQHFKYALDNPKDVQTDSKRFGTAGHELFLEPGRFKTRVVRAPINPKTDKAFGSETKAWAEFAEGHPGKLILTDEEIARLALMAAAIKRHHDAAAFLDSEGMCEVVIVWDDEITGLRCKARIDKVVPTVGRGDFKTCQSAHWPEFSRAIVDFGYVTQDPFYGRGVLALKKAGVIAWPENSIFIAAETEAPFGVAVYTLKEPAKGMGDSDTYQRGEVIVTEWLLKVRECRERDNWPGYPDHVCSIEAPEWWLKRFGAGVE